MVNRHLNTPLRACRYCCIDFETTGSVSGYRCLPWQVGTCRVVNGEVDASGIDTFIRVPQNHRFNSHTPGIYRTHREVIATAPTSGEVWQALHSELAVAVVVAHNIGTERKQLAQMAPMSNYEPWIDTLLLSRRIYPGLSSYALDDLLRVLGLQDQVVAFVPDRSPHDAYYDAVGCAVLLRHLILLPGWCEMSVRELIEGVS